MESQDHSPVSRELSLLRRLGQWLGFAFVQHPILFCSSAFLLFIALFYLEENWSGKRAWTRYENELRARGEPVLISEVVPPPVPDSQNFVATPFWTGLNYKSDPNDKEDANRWPEFPHDAMSKIAKLRPKPVTEQVEPIRYRRWNPVDLPALAVAFTNAELRNARDINQVIDLADVTDVAARAQAGVVILERMKVYDSVLEELREASARPKARFPVNYNEPNPFMFLLPHLARVKGVCSVMKVKITAELAVGNSDQALADLMLMIRIADALGGEPIMISQLVRLACFHLVASTVWESLRFEYWNESQLAMIQHQLSRPLLIQGAETSLRGERAAANTFFDFMGQAGSSERLEELWGDWYDVQVSFNYMPSGWLYFEQLNYNLFMDDHIMPVPVSGPRRIDPSFYDQMQRDLDLAFSTHGYWGTFWSHTIFARVLLPALSRLVQKAAHGQAAVELAMMACALERFRLAHGDYPATLDELIPGFIERVPEDVVAAVPYQYWREEGGRFVLYSIGWNATDDKGFELRDITQADWVWRY